jgi:hypothetical protein
MVQERFAKLELVREKSSGDTPIINVVLASAPGQEGNFPKTIHGSDDVVHLALLYTSELSSQYSVFVLPFTSNSENDLPI